MSDPRVMGGVVPARATSDNIPIVQRGLRDGSTVVANYLEALAQEGRIFAANMGSVTTPLTFLVTAANRPDAFLRVPLATPVLVLPVSVIVVLEGSAGTVNEIDVRMCANDIGNGTSSAATVGPVSTRSDTSMSALAIPRQLATADTTAEVTPVSLYRRTYARADEAGIGNRGIEITREMMSYPVLNSGAAGATLELFIAATTTQATGFVIMTWVELPTTLLT